MSDKPYVGYPSAPKPKKKAQLYQDTWLDNFIKGFFGDEEASGSVLEPEKRAKNVKANDIGQMLGIGTDLIDLPKSALMAIPALAGAIRYKGAKDLVASHAFGTSAAEKIHKSGFLNAPSIGVSSRELNDYSSTSPEFLFAAGKVDPARLPGAMLNRDGYFANPSGIDYITGLWDPKTLENSVKYEKQQALQEYGVDDLRLGQMFPSASQGVAIAASPNFRSFAEYEKSPAGAATLRKKKDSREPAWKELDRQIKEAAEWGGTTLHYDSDTKQYAKKLIKKVNTGGLENAPSNIQKLWQDASVAPSAMAELKLFDQLPLNPRDSSIFVPRQSITEDTLSRLRPFRDDGFQIFSPYNLGNYSGSHSRFDDWVPKRLASTVPPEGGLRLPRDKTIDNDWLNIEHWQRDAWNDFINLGAGGSPPLDVLKQTSSKVSSNPHGVPATWHNMKNDLDNADMGDYFDMLDEAPADFAAWYKAQKSTKEPSGVAPAGGHVTFNGTKLNLPQNGELYEELLQNADEYTDVLEQAIKEHNIQPHMHDQALKFLYDNYKNSTHMMPNWHAELKDDLKFFGLNDATKGPPLPKESPEQLIYQANKEFTDSMDEASATIKGSGGINTLDVPKLSVSPDTQKWADEYVEFFESKEEFTKFMEKAELHDPGNIQAVKNAVLKKWGPGE